MTGAKRISDGIPGRWSARVRIGRRGFDAPTNLESSPEPISISTTPAGPAPSSNRASPPSQRCKFLLSFRDGPNGCIPSLFACSQPGHGALALRTVAAQRPRGTHAHASVHSTRRRSCSAAALLCTFAFASMPYPWIHSSARSYRQLPLPEHLIAASALSPIFPSYNESLLPIPPIETGHTRTSPVVTAPLPSILLPTPLWRASPSHLIPRPDVSGYSGTYFTDRPSTF